MSAIKRPERIGAVPGRLSAEHDLPPCGYPLRGLDAERLPGFQAAASGVGRLPGRPCRAYAIVSDGQLHAPAFTRHDEAVTFTNGQNAAGVMVSDTNPARAATDPVRDCTTVVPMSVTPL